MTTATTERRATADTEARPGLLGGRVDERNLGLLVVRVVIGVVFVGHGMQKLFGSFNGGGISGTTSFFASAGYSPAKPIAVLSGIVEFGGGIALILGLGASAAAAAIAANMAGATAVTADQGNGAFFAANNGYEYTLVLGLVALGLALTGAGRLSLDDGRVWDRRPVRYALTALAVVAGALAVIVR